MALVEPSPWSKSKSTICIKLGKPPSVQGVCRQGLRLLEYKLILTSSLGRAYLRRLPEFQWGRTDDTVRRKHQMLNYVRGLEQSQSTYLGIYSARVNIRRRLNGVAGKWTGSQVDAALGRKEQVPRPRVDAKAAPHVGVCLTGREIVDRHGGLLQEARQMGELVFQAP
ncbi:hypothetical protein J3458_009496 [Metarhizium acridum]|uniref:uncharacterized protein n=1 Tax=Metarhizium acridum TaxID=92637 RepID=UPI001C6A946B|nr:hypothetical protein J3458_009496 [Metarhizium acridum]